MPGGFPSLSAQRGGYQDVDAGRDVEAANPRPAQATAPPPQAPPPQAPGGYQAAAAPADPPSKP